MMDNENSGKSGMDKVSVIGSIVCVGILGLIMYMNFTAPKPQPPVRPAVSAPLTSAPIESLPAVAAPIAEENAPVDTSWMADAPDLHLARQGEFDAKFCAIGGGIETVTLEQFTVQTNVEAEKSDLVVMGNGGQPFLRCDVEEGFYVQQAAPYQLENGTIVLEQLSADGALKAVQTWQPIQGSDYEMKYSLTVQNMSGTVQSVPRMMIGCGALPAFLSRQKQSYLSGNAGFVAYGIPGKDKAEILLEKKIKKLNDKPEKRQALAETPASWLAVSSKYFLFAMRHPKLVLQFLYLLRICQVLVNFYLRTEHIL